MKTWQDWKIGTRLVSVFGVFLLGLVALAGLGLTWLGRVNAKTTTEIQLRFNLAKLSNDTIANSTDNARLTMQLFDTTDPDIERKLNDENDAISKQIGAAVGEIEKSLHSPEERELFEVVAHNRSAYVEARQRAKALLLGKKRDQAVAALNGEVLPALAVYRASWIKFIDFQSRAMQQSIADSADAYSKGRKIAVVLLVFALVFASAVGIAVTRSITLPIQQAVEHAQSIAAGDLNRTIRITDRAETGRLLQAMQEMAGKLSSVIRDVREGSSAVASAAAQVSASSQNLSQGTNEQAASVEETSSSLEQMNASITQNADNSRRVEQVAEKGARSAEESGSAVHETVEAMKQIAARISVIEDIAYQTNLLALNAAIEAARAGDQGRGFAVVAVEVRKLAERSQMAAKEISDLAAKSVSVAEHSGKLLADLVPAIRQTAELVQEVAAASTEQSSGVTQINRAMSQVDEVTQRNASSAEELSSTAEELAAQSAQLQQLMTFFHIADDRTAGHNGDGKAAALAYPKTMTVSLGELNVSRPAGNKPAGETSFSRF
ncbi:MAG TPA: methyl-accepting chemotaxis protein [Candidatus Binatia bacterium]|nr:methyl-accepting chemotaxis protein [Candidatus Binatia bacterium]